MFVIYELKWIIANLRIIVKPNNKFETSYDLIKFWIGAVHIDISFVIYLRHNQKLHIN